MPFLVVYLLIGFGVLVLLIKFDLLGIFITITEYILDFLKLFT